MTVKKNSRGKTPEQPQYQAESLVHLLRRRAQQQADDLAYLFLHNGEEESQRYSYAELDALCRRSAVRLRSEERV